KIGDFLDGITVIVETLAANGRRQFIDRWLAFVGRVFQEENLSYRIDPKGSVHPLVDAEFEVNRNATLEALNETRFGEACGDFEAAFRHLRNGEGKAAIRSMFPSVESAAKVLFP